MKRLKMKDSAADGGPPATARKVAEQQRAKRGGRKADDGEVAAAAKSPTRRTRPAAVESVTEFIHTGCTVLDCVLGGGYAMGRIINIVGDKSTGKTLLAIEACANFIRHYPKGEIVYNEVEAAFDADYAASLGLPVDHIHFTEDCFTIEDMFADIRKRVVKRKTPLLYVVDSLDAMSDKGELERNVDKGSYGTQKAKMLSQLFRQLVRDMSAGQLTLLVISQIRDNLNAVPFGKKYVRSGGRALDFYASQAIYLAQVAKLTKQINAVKRVTGVKIKALCDKNKVGLPFRSCEFPIVFNYGIDDITASIEWLKEIKQDSDLTDGKMLRELVIRKWAEIEADFHPTTSKYGPLLSAIGKSPWSPLN